MNDSDSEKAYYKAVGLISQKRYKEALKVLSSLYNVSSLDLKQRVFFETAKCFYYLKLYDESLKYFNMISQKYPEYNELDEVYYFTGLCYMESGNKQKGIEFFNRVLSVAGQGDPVYRKASRSLKEAQ